MINVTENSGTIDLMFRNPDILAGTGTFDIASSILDRGLTMKQVFY